MVHYRQSLKDYCFPHTGFYLQKYTFNVEDQWKNNEIENFPRSLHVMQGMWLDE